MLRTLALLPCALLLSLTTAAWGAPLSLLRRAAAAVGAGGGDTAAAGAGAGAMQWPIELHNLTWTSERGAILLNGRQFHLKGLNWFGLESETRYVSCKSRKTRGYVSEGSGSTYPDLALTRLSYILNTQSPAWPVGRHARRHYDLSGQQQGTARSKAPTEARIHQRVFITSKPSSHRPHTRPHTTV